jgi:hypothetical protein
VQTGHTDASGFDVGTRNPVTPSASCKNLRSLPEFDDNLDFDQHS